MTIKLSSILKVTGKIFLGLLILMIIGSLILHMPSVQSRIASLVVSKISKNTDIDIRIGGIAITLPNSVIVKGLYVEDIDKDTLVYAGKIKLTIGLFKLIKKDVKLYLAEVNNTTVKLKRFGADSTFNFNHLQKAFAGDPKKAEQHDTISNGGKVNIEIGRIRLDGFRFVFHDGTTQNIYKTRLGQLKINVDEFAIEEKKIIFNSIKLADSDIEITINSKEEEENKAPSPVDLDIGINRELSLEDVNFRLTDNFSKQTMAVHNANLKVDPNKIHLPSYLIDLEKIELAETKIEIHKRKISTDDSLRMARLNNNGYSQPFPWIVKAGELILDENEFIFVDANKPKKQNGIDFTDLYISELEANFTDLNLRRNHLETEMNNLGFKEKSGFELSEMSVSFFFSENSAEIRNMHLKTPFTNLENSVTLQYSSILTLQENPTEIIFGLQQKPSKIGMKDLYYFQPELKNRHQVFSKTGQAISLSGKISGDSTQVSVETFFLEYDSTMLVFHGSLHNYRDIAKARANIQLDKLQTTKNNIYVFLPDTLIPENINLPNNLNMQARAEGSMKSFRASANLASSFGLIDLTAKMQPDTMPDKRHFSTNLNVKSFELGKLLTNDTLGTTTFNVKATGKLDKDSVRLTEANASLHVDTLDFRGYQYTQFKFSGNYEDKLLTGKASITDSNIVFDLDANINLQDSIPDYDLAFHLKGADLQGLLLMNEDITSRMSVFLRFKGNNIDDANGEMKISDLLIVKKGKRYELDSINASIKNTKDETEISLRSDPVKAHYSGTVKMDEIKDALSLCIDEYFELNRDNTIIIDTTNHFKFKVDVYNADIITQVIVPGLEDFYPGSIEGEYKGTDNSLRLKADFPSIKYKGNSLDSLKFVVNSSDTNSLDYSLSYKRLAFPPLVMGNTSLEGSLAKNNVRFSLKVKDNEHTDKYIVSGKIKSENNVFIIHFLPQPLIINYNEFNIPENNYIAFKDEGLDFENIRFTSGEQKIIVTKEETQSISSAYHITISNFELSNITGIFEDRGDLIDGLIEGKLAVGERNGKNVFNADLMLSNLAIVNDTAFRSISLKADNLDGNRLTIESRMSGEENELVFSGFLNTDQQPTAIDFSVDVKKLDISYFTPFLQEQIESMDGTISGSIDVSGNTETPDIQGNLELADTRIVPSYIGTPLEIKKEKINIRNRTVSLNNFVLYDDTGNEAVLNGTANFTDMTQPQFDISLRSKDFMFLNTTYNDNQLYYGKLIAGLDVDLKGSANNPSIDINVNIRDGSSFNVVVPGFNTASIEKEGIVKFVDRNDTMQINIIERSLENKDIAQNISAKTIVFNANLEISDGTRISIVIDPTSKEELRVNGNANLSMSMMGGGAPNLTGRFEISDGTYTLMLYDVIRRTFNIEKGSYLQWNGDIMNARSNITAIYNVRTSPLPLISDEATGLSSSAGQKYSNNVPFLVKLNISGHLLQPKINFDLSQAESNDALIQAKLNRLKQNEAELNKQVFSLLLFNSFMQTGTAADRSIEYELNATARTSVSRLLTQQINSFTKRYIKGVDVGVAVNSYYQAAGDQSTGRTEVSLDVSKQLFNDRLSVQLGGDFNVEGPQQKKEQDFNSIAGDVVVEYKLDKDGTYLLRGFNQTEHEDFIDGEVTKTGASLIYNKDFYNLSNLFRKKEDIKIESDTVEVKQNIK